MFEGIRMKQNKSNNTIFKNWIEKLSNPEQKRKRTGGRRKKRRKNRGTRRGKNLNEGAQTRMENNREKKWLQ